MSLLFNEYVELMSQMLPLFSSRGLWWKRCVGPGTQVGLTFDELLSLLQPLNPEWDTNLLTIVLRRGLQFGTLKQFPVGTYFANAQMIPENNWNKVFLNVVPTLCDTTLKRKGPFMIY